MAGLTNETPLDDEGSHATQEKQMPDPTEPIRRQRLVEINAEPGSREALEAQYGKVWTAIERYPTFVV